MKKYGGMELHDAGVMPEHNNVVETVPGKKEKPKPQYQTATFQDIPGLEGCDVGDEYMMTARVVVKKVLKGEEYGNEEIKKGAPHKVTVQFEHVGFKPHSETKSHDDYAEEGSEKRSKRAQEIIDGSKGDDD